MSVKENVLDISVGLHLSNNFLPGLFYLDVGVILSGEISPILNDSKLSLKAKSKLDKILSAELEKNRKQNQNYLALKNLGILFEKELKIELMNIIKQFSDDCALVLKHEGKIKEDCFYFNTERGIATDLKSITYRDYEV